MALRYRIGSESSSEAVSGSVDDAADRWGYVTKMVIITKIEAAPRDLLYITEWMDKLDLKDEIVAKRMRKPRVTVWRWRTEQKRLNPKKIAALASAMGLTPGDLWRPPNRPSLDAIVKDASDELVERIATIITIMVKAEK